MSGSTAFKRCILDFYYRSCQRFGRLERSCFGYESFIWEEPSNTVSGLEFWVPKSWYIRSGFLVWNLIHFLYTPYLDLYNISDFAVTHDHRDHSEKFYPARDSPAPYLKVTFPINYRVLRSHRLPLCSPPAHHHNHETLVQSYLPFWRLCCGKVPVCTNPACQPYLV